LHFNQKLQQPERHAFVGENQRETHVLFSSATSMTSEFMSMVRSMTPMPEVFLIGFDVDGAVDDADA
jgi:hypothetical protein